MRWRSEAPPSRSSTCKRLPSPWSTTDQALTRATACRLGGGDIEATVIDGIGIVFAREFVDGSPIATTNAFVREGGGWKMLLHHTSLVVQRS